MPKPKTQKELREEAEQKAAELRAAKALEAAEAEAKKQEQAKESYDQIWAAFAKDLKKHGKAFANSQLLENLTNFASYLVPIMMTAKEHTSLIMELAEKESSGKGHGGESPTSLMGKWLRGEADLSRVPLDKVKAQPVQ